MSLASIQKEIIQLNPTERAMLIDLLWESLDEARIKEIEAKWATESEDRIDAFERGELSAVDYMQLEHLMRLAKARARDFLPNE